MIKGRERRNDWRVKKIEQRNAYTERVKAVK
jgi:hypothetical protein